jgi:hypothetical protein
MARTLTCCHGLADMAGSACVNACATEVKDGAAPKKRLHQFQKILPYAQTAAAQLGAAARAIG